MTQHSLNRDQLTTSQNDGIVKMKNWYFNPNKKQVFSLAGAAGTGKSSLVEFAMDELGLDDVNIAYVSYTGKASLVLVEKGNKNACTIHKLIYDAKYCDSKKTFIFSLKKQLPSYLKLIVVDEISMVSSKLLEDLLSYNIPVVVIGDPFQLPPPFGSQHNYLEYPDVLLLEVHRQALDNPILHLATVVREYIDQKIKIDSQTMLIDLCQKHNIEVGTRLKIASKEEMKTAYREQMLDTDNYQIICGFNETRLKANNWVRKELGFTSRNPMWLEKIICLQNNWELPIGGKQSGAFLTNGMMGIIDESPIIYNDRIINFWFKPDFKDASSIFLPAYRESFNTGLSNFNFKGRLAGKCINSFTYGYCITCHKSQGSEFKNVMLLYEPVGRGAIEKLKWFYTSITRAKESLVIGF